MDFYSLIHNKITTLAIITKNYFFIMKKLLLACMLAFGLTSNAQITLGGGSTTVAGTIPVPISSYYGYSWVQQIFTKSEINASGSGTITGLKFYIGATKSIANSDDWKVYLGHTTKTDFTSSTDWIPVAQLTEVFASTVVNNNGVVEVTLTTPFNYDNVNNLVLAIDENKPNYDNNAFTEEFYIYTGQANGTLYYKDDTTNPDPTSPPTTGFNLGRSSSKSSVTFDGLTPNAIPTCPSVSAPVVNATNVSLTPTFTWSSVAGATGYRISIGTGTGLTNVLYNFDNGANTSYSLATPLNYSTQYFYTITAYSGSGTSTGCTERSFTTMNVPCPVVTSPVANEAEVILTPTITWDPVTSATSYTLSVGTTSGGTNILNNVDVGTNTSYTFTTPLQNSTKYYYTVNANVGTATSASCAIRNFTTICTAGTVFSENFDGIAAGVWPACWSKLGTGGSAYTQASAVMSGPNNLYIYSGSSTSQAVVSMPPVTTLQTDQYRLKFNGRANFTAGGVVEIGFLANPTDASTFSLLGTYTASSTSTIDSFVLNIAGVPAGIERLAFRHTGSPANSVLIDNIVYELIPTCLEPTSFHALSSTQNSIDLEWNPPTTPPAQGYDIRVTNPGTGTVYNFTAAAADLSKTVTGLPNSTTFDVCIRAKCSTTDMSPWVCFTASTLCGPVVPTYANNFTTFPGVCWSYGSGGDATTGPTGTTQEWYADTFLNATSGSNSAKINLWNSGTKGWLITPEFDLTGGSFIVAFDYGMTEYADTVAATLGSDDKVQFLMSTDGGTTWSVINEWTASTPISNISTAFTHTVTGGTANVKFAFYGTEGTVDDSASPTQNDNDIFIDNFQVISSALGTTEQTLNEKTVKVYPNPFSDILNISDVREVASVTITDMAGRMVKTIAKPSSQLQLGDLKSGMYLVTLKYKDGSVKTVKTIKK